MAPVTSGIIVSSGNCALEWSRWPQTLRWFFRYALATWFCADYAFIQASPRVETPLKFQGISMYPEDRVGISNINPQY